MSSVLAGRKTPLSLTAVLELKEPAPLWENPCHVSQTESPAPVRAAAGGREALSGPVSSGMGGHRHNTPERGWVLTTGPFQPEGLVCVPLGEKEWRGKSRDGLERKEGALLLRTFSMGLAGGQEPVRALALGLQDATPGSCWSVRLN